MWAHHRNNTEYRVHGNRKFKAVADFNHLVPTLFFKFLPPPPRAFFISLYKGQAHCYTGRQKNSHAACWKRWDKYPCVTDAMPKVERMEDHLLLKVSGRLPVVLIWAPPSGWWLNFVEGSHTGRHCWENITSLQRCKGEIKGKHVHGMVMDSHWICLRPKSCLTFHCGDFWLVSWGIQTHFRITCF